MKRLSAAAARKKKIIALARQHGGEALEIGAAAKVSEGGDNGAYVQAWMWVSFEGTPLDKEGASS